MALKARPQGATAPKTMYSLIVSTPFPPKVVFGGQLQKAGVSPPPSQLARPGQRRTNRGYTLAGAEKVQPYLASAAR